ncbi:MAG: hypothetical protein JSV70_05450 [bacterium]|nr:MAG: hypothetical protein JSV70_05450 [bacterium]
MMSVNSGISELESMVRARGLRISRINPEEGLLLPESGREGDIKAYRATLDHYAARLLLKEVIKANTPEKWMKGRRQVERFCDSSAVDEFLSRFADLRVLKVSEEGVPVPFKPVYSFGPTYEWYAARVLKEDFSCPSAWGVTFGDHGSGGDHDVIASLAGRFLYMEVKTSPPGRIEPPEIGGFVRRLIDIAPDVAIFNNDTHLRMIDKVVPYMEEAIQQSETQRPKAPEENRDTKPASASSAAPRQRFVRLEREIFHLKGSVYIINSKPDLKRNLEVVFRHYTRLRSRVLESLV